MFHFKLKIKKNGTQLQPYLQMSRMILRTKIQNKRGEKKKKTISFLILHVDNISIVFSRMVLAVESNPVTKFAVFRRYSGVGSRALFEAPTKIDGNASEEELKPGVSNQVGTSQPQHPPVGVEEGLAS